MQRIGTARMINIGQQANSRISINIEGFNRLIFDKRELKAAIRKGGNVVKTESRRLISHRAISAAGEIPGYKSGVMSRSIKAKVGSGGGYVRIMPTKTPEMGKDFYPAYLSVGTRRGLKPRKDFMLQALDNKQIQIRAAISATLLNAIKTA